MRAGEAKRAGSGAVWVLVVLAIGLLVGVLLSAVPIASDGRWPGRGPGWGLRLETAADVDVVLSSVSATLLVALVIVYARTYRDTEAAFALGLTVVLVALLVETILTSPLVYGAFGAVAGGLALFLLIASVFKIGAYTGFLYLSLQ